MFEDAELGRIALALAEAPKLTGSFCFQVMRNATGWVVTDVNPRPGEDMAWFIRALENGATAARVPQARALYRNQGSLRHMFRKGWLESRVANELTGAPGMTLWQLGICWGSLLKKWGAAKIPAPVLFRQCAHALGACLSPKFSGKPGTPGQTR